MKDGVDTNFPRVLRPRIFDPAEKTLAQILVHSSRQPSCAAARLEIFLGLISFVFCQ